MTIIAESRLSDSPYVATVIQGYTVSDGSSIRPAETHWHMVFTKHDGRWHPLLVGPLTSSGTTRWGANAEILWIKFKLGTFMPHLPVKKFLDGETELPGANSNSFWLKGAAWQFPDFENVDNFVDKLVREEILVHDPLISVVLEGQPHDLSARTIRHRFLRATGLRQSHIYQMERAQRAQALLQQGYSILDTVYEAGYFDQPHLTRSLKQWVGYTPAQIVRMSQACHSAQGNQILLDYHANVLENIR